MATNVSLQPVYKKKIINIQILKNRFAQKFPDSPILQILLEMPNEMEVEELIGSVGVWLSILDMESAKYIKGGK
ncbi:MAG: hypothetical protein QXL94_01465 [Candidatus Parvarchaeum sp.]|jgi:hypothetical protein